MGYLRGCFRRIGSFCDCNLFSYSERLDYHRQMIHRTRLIADHFLEALALHLRAHMDITQNDREKISDMLNLIRI